MAANTPKVREGLYDQCECGSTRSLHSGASCLRRRRLWSAREEHVRCMRSIVRVGRARSMITTAQRNIGLCSLLISRHHATDGAQCGLSISNPSAEAILRVTARTLV